MRASYAPSPQRPAASPPRGVRIARLVIALYFCACALHGFIRLRDGGGGVEASMAVLHLWYLEALAFLALWGAIALIVALAKGGGGERRPRKRSAKASGGSSLLAALERDRGR